MDGMMIGYHTLRAYGNVDYVVTNTINLVQPTSVIAQISLCTFDTASASFGKAMTAYGVFIGCTTNGTNPPLPAVETFSFFSGSTSGKPRSIVIRNGLTSITYEMDVANSNADFIVNLFLWPSVTRGNL